MQRLASTLVLAVVTLAAALSAVPAQAAWTKVELVDDKVDGDTIGHQGRDTVSAIWFKDLNHGLIATLEGEGSQGGAIFTASADKVTSVAFRGYNMAVDKAQHVGFRDLVPTDEGMVALLTRADTFIHADKDGKWTMESPGGDFGVETQLALQPLPGGKWLYVTGTGVVWVADELPGKGVEWKTIWFPEGNPPVPDPVPAGMCPEAAISNTPGMLPFHYVYVSPDGQTIAYPMHSKPAVCVSTDGGKRWLEHELPGAPESVGEAGPYGIYFTDKQHGWTFYANDLKESSAYIYRTTDGGLTWSAGKLPESVTAADSRANFRGMFFAPDGQHGWLVGYRGDNTIPLLLRTSDGGATWVDKSTGRNSLKTVLESGTKLFCGCALDADHIWVGGGYGTLAYCDNASQ